MSNYITDSKQVNLSSTSAFTNNGTKNSQMLFKLNGLLVKERNIQYNQISIPHCQIPISYYVVNSTNNYLSTNRGNFTLTNGNYNATTFVTMLLGLLGVGWSMTISSTTGVYTLTYTNSFTINSTSTCQKFLGMANSTSYSSTSNAITFPFPCNFLGINRIKIKSSVFKTKNIDTSSSGRCDLLTTIAVNNANGGLLTYQNNTRLFNHFENTNVDYVDISITDENDNLIDFNNIPVYITLQIDTIRENIPFSDSLHEMLGNTFE